MGHHADDLTREVDHGATAASQAAERIEHVIQRRGDPLAPPGRSRDNPEGNQQDITLDNVLRVSHDRDEIARRNLRLRRHWERGGTGHGLMWTQQYNIVERQPLADPVRHALSVARRHVVSTQEKRALRVVWLLIGAYFVAGLVLLCCRG